MGLEDRAIAAAKDIEGKVQEAAGEVTDNTAAQAKGKAKQAQAVATQIVEDVIDIAIDLIDKFSSALLILQEAY